MKIESIRTLGQPANMRSWSLIEVRSSNGLSGIGMTSAPVSAIHGIISSPGTGMARHLIGKDPRDINSLVRIMTGKWPAELGRYGDGGLAINAAAAIEQALWDILGKSLGQPLHRLFGGSQTDRVRLYASGSAFNEHLYETERKFVHRSTEQLVTIAKAHVANGFTAFKFGWGNHYGEAAMETLRAVRAAVGPSIAFMLDFGCPAYLNDRWTLKEAIRVSEKLAGIGIDFWEEPLPPGDCAGYAALTKASPIRIATGESLTKVDEFQRLIDARAIDIVQPDVGQLGISAFWRIANAARDAGIACVPHGPWGAPFVAGHVHLLGCLSTDGLVEYPAQLSYPSGSSRDQIVDNVHRRLFTQPLEVDKGHLVLPQGPGLGLGDWNHAQVAAFEALLPPAPV
jgi:L-alanine-DL-glutamate epimerase-like enolase superfamily enzyme